MILGDVFEDIFMIKNVKKDIHKFPAAVVQKTLGKKAAFSFSCTKCGNCCREEGDVYFTSEDLEKIYEHLQLKGNKKNLLYKKLIQKKKTIIMSMKPRTLAISLATAALVQSIQSAPSNAAPSLFGLLFLLHPKILLKLQKAVQELRMELRTEFRMKPKKARATVQKKQQRKFLLRKKNF